MEYSLDGTLIWNNEVKNEDNIKDYLNKYDSRKDEITSTAPSGYSAQINLNNIIINGKNC